MPTSIFTTTWTISIPKMISTPKGPQKVIETVVIKDIVARQLPIKDLFRDSTTMNRVYPHLTKDFTNRMRPEHIKISFDKQIGTTNY